MGPVPDRPEGLFAELGRWRDKAAKRGRVTPFESDIIPDWLNAEIVAAQEAVGPDAAFSFLKQVPLSVRMAAERRVQSKITGILAGRKREALQAAREGRAFDYEGLAEELRAAIEPELAELAVDGTMRLSAETGISFDPAIINEQAVRWAREYSFDLVQGLTNTTRNQIREVTAAFLETPGMTVGDVQALLEPGFGEDRAQMIAETELTRANAESTNETQRLLRQDVPELETTRIVNTQQDELVCPVCGPLEGAPESVWGSQYPNGPPFHPRCRCDLSLSFETQGQLDTEFGERQTERERWLRAEGLWTEQSRKEEREVELGRGVNV